MPSRINGKLVGGLYRNGKVVGGRRINGKVFYRRTPPVPGELPVSVVLANLPGHLATTAQGASSINDRNDPAMVFFAVGAVTGGAYSNIIRIGYPSDTPDSAFPSSVTISRAAIRGRAAYQATTTARSAATVSGGIKRVDYQMAVNPVRNVDVQQNDTVTLTFTFAAPDREGMLSVTVQRNGRNEDYTYTLTDPDGIRAVGTLNLTSRDGRTATVNLARVDTNTFRGTRTSANDRWLQATATINYTDALTGTIHTITQPYSV